MPIRHVIQQGDSVIQLSEVHGLFAETIWDDPANADLKAERKDMNILLPGDVVVIPDIRPKGERVETLQHHRFRRKGIPAKFRLQVFDVEEPRANQDYTLDIDDTYHHEGTTDEQGILEIYLSPDAREGKLIVGPDQYFLELDFGYLDPITEIVGVQKRLNNLGYHCGDPDGVLNEKTMEALADFQHRFGLDPTGEPDEATLKMLEDVHENPNDVPEPPDEED